MGLETCELITCYLLLFSSLAMTFQDSSQDLPMLAVYETIDLGLVKSLNESSTSLLDLFRGNHPVLLLDPLHDDMIYVYHAFGVHALDISPVIESLSAALREENEDGSLLKEGLEKATTISVRPILNTFSVEKKLAHNAPRSCFDADRVFQMF